MFLCNHLVDKDIGNMAAPQRKYLSCRQVMANFQCIQWLVPTNQHVSPVHSQNREEHQFYGSVGKGDFVYGQYDLEGECIVRFLKMK